MDAKEQRHGRGEIREPGAQYRRKERNRGTVEVEKREHGHGRGGSKGTGVR